MPVVAGFPSVPPPPARPGRGARASGPSAWLVRTCADAGCSLLRVALVLLAGFHAWLFGDHLIAGSVFDPLVALRWAAGGLLLFAFLWLRRRGVSLVWGRRAIVLWLLVAVLHAHAAWTPADAASAAPAREAAVLALQAVSVAAVVAGLALMSALARVRALVPPVTRLAALVSPATPLAWVLALCILGPRPPPCC